MAEAYAFGFWTMPCAGFGNAFRPFAPSGLAPQHDRDQAWTIGVGGAFEQDVDGWARIKNRFSLDRDRLPSVSQAGDSPVARNKRRRRGSVLCPRPHGLNAALGVEEFAECSFIRRHMDDDETGSP